MPVQMPGPPRPPQRMNDHIAVTCCLQYCHSVPPLIASLWRPVPSAVCALEQALKICWLKD